MTDWQNLIDELTDRELVRVARADRIELEHDRADASEDYPYPLLRFIDRRADGSVVVTLAAGEARSAAFTIDADDIPGTADQILSFFSPEVPT